MTEDKLDLWDVFCHRYTYVSCEVDDGASYRCDLCPDDNYDCWNEPTPEIVANHLKEKHQKEFAEFCKKLKQLLCQ